MTTDRPKDCTCIGKPSWCSACFSSGYATPRTPPDLASEVATLRAENQRLRKERNEAVGLLNAVLDRDASVSSEGSAHEHSWRVEGDGEYEPFETRCEDCGVSSEGSGE